MATSSITANFYTDDPKAAKKIFITLTIREPQDYTKWRANMYKDETVHSIAERARAAGARFRKTQGVESVAPRV